MIKLIFLKIIVFFKGIWILMLKLSMVNIYFYSFFVLLNTNNSLEYPVSARRKVQWFHADFNYLCGFVGQKTHVKAYTLYPLQLIYCCRILMGKKLKFIPILYESQTGLPLNDPTASSKTLSIVPILLLFVSHALDSSMLYETLHFHPIWT